MSTFVAKGVSYQASEGNHDDLMMNLVMFGYFAVGRNFEDLTDINLKEMMFEQRMKEIENDMVPFGWIDNGDPQDALEAAILEEENSSWSVNKDWRGDRNF